MFHAASDERGGARCGLERLQGTVRVMGDPVEARISQSNIEKSIL